MPPVRCTFILSPRRRLIRIGLAHEAILLSSSSSVFLLLESLELSARATTQNLPLRGFLCDWDRNDLGYNGFSTLGVRRLLCSTYEARVRFGTRVRVRVRVWDSAIFEKGGCGCGKTRRLKNY